MKAKKGLLCGLAITALSFALASCGGQGTQTEQMVGMAELSSWMTGSFSTAEQAAADTSFLDVNLRIVPIWENRQEGYWFYAEQATSAEKDKPYHQRVYQVSQLNDTTFQSSVYTIDDPLRFAGAWNEPEPLSELSPDSLNPREGCEIILFARSDSTFTGGTLGDFCESERSGATWMTSIMRVNSDMIYIWERGFDEKGSQVWGAVKGGYEFRRINEEMP